MKRISILKRLRAFFSAKEFIVIMLFLIANTALAVVYPFIYKLFIDQVLFEKDIRVLKTVLLLMAGWMVCSGTIKYLLCRIRTDFLVDLLYGIKQFLICAIMAKSLSDCLQRTPSERKHVVEDDCNEIEQFFLADIFGFMVNVLNVCAFAVVMLAISPPLWAGCAVLFTLSYYETKLIKGKVMANATELRNALAREDHLRSDELRNLKDIKCLNYTEEMLSSFHERSRQIVRLIKKEQIYFFVNKYLGALNHDLISRFFVYALGGLLVIGGSLQISSFLVFLGFYESFVKYIRMVIDSNFNLDNKGSRLENILEYLAEDSFERDGEEAWAAGHIGCIRLRDVSFRYPGSRDGRYAIQGFGHEFHRGGTYLIQGRSGAGKSMLMKLLYRELEQYQGSITVNTEELSACPGAYYGRIAVAAHDSRLFHTTIRENLLFADSAATDGMLLQACEDAQLGKDLKKLPEGLDAPVGENGSALSGGQRQRLILSRLFLRHADLYILDEALDEIGIADEVEILDRLRARNKDSIILVISHRLTQYRDAQRVLIQ